MFRVAILAKHVTGDNKHRPETNYTTLVDKYNFTGLSFPIPLPKIKTFEKNNSKDFVNVYIFLIFSPSPKTLLTRVRILYYQYMIPLTYYGNLV